MTRQLIEITFGNAIAQANQLEACADEMTALSNRRLAEIQDNIQAAWQGESAAAYVQKLELTGERMRITANKLCRIAQTLRETARQFRDAELGAIEIAQQRTC